jgi:hypothetical protein
MGTKMKKYLRIILSLVSGLLLILGSMDAQAYTISPTWDTPGLYLQAYLGGTAGTYTEFTRYHARMENVNGDNSAISDWTISTLPITESWGPEGKTTTIGQRIEADMSANLADIYAILGNSAFLLQGFAISSDSSPPLTTPKVTLTVAWGGDVDPNLASAQIALQEVHDGLTFVDVIPISNVNLNSPGNQQIFQGIFPEMGDTYFLTLNLWDGVTWPIPGEYETAMWISVTMSVTEAVAPPPPVPLPGTLALLASGLAIILGSGRRHRNA